MRKIRKGDSVVVTAGREKGRTGTVVGVQADGRVLVESERAKVGGSKS